MFQKKLYKITIYFLQNYHLVIYDPTDYKIWILRSRFNEMSVLSLLYSTPILYSLKRNWNDHHKSGLRVSTKTTKQKLKEIICNFIDYPLRKRIFSLLIIIISIGIKLTFFLLYSENGKKIIISLLQVPKMSEIPGNCDAGE